MNIHGLRALHRVFFLELLRQKLVWMIAGLGGIVFLLGVVLGNLSFSEQERIFFHLSITGIHTFGLVLALVLGSTGLHREIEKQTCLLVLSRPLSRNLFYWAQFIAVSSFLFLFDVSLAFVVGLSLKTEFGLTGWFTLISGIYTEHLIVLSLSMFAAQKMRPFIAGFFAFGIFLVGNWLPDLHYFAQKSQSALFRGLVDVLNRICPHFDQLNFRNFEALTMGLSSNSILYIALHGLGWIILLNLLGSFLWQRRDLV